MTIIDERNVDPLGEMHRIAEDFLNLLDSGFRESYRSITSQKLIYDSEWCRIKLVWGGWDYGGGNSIDIRYGRLHASNEEVVMLWNGEECRCWHDFGYALHFLDGRTPSEAAKLRQSHPATEPFYEEGFRKSYSRRQPEWLAKMHTTIWREYGTRFFELFDLRRPDSWKQYRRFLEEVYNITGRSPAIKPPSDEVC